MEPAGLFLMLGILLAGLAGVLIGGACLGARVALLASELQLLETELELLRRELEVRRECQKD